MQDREKELKKLIYIRSEIIKQCKKDIKKYHEELNQINGYKKLEKKPRKKVVELVKEWKENE